MRCSSFGPNIPQTDPAYRRNRPFSGRTPVLLSGLCDEIGAQLRLMGDECRPIQNRGPQSRSPLSPGKRRPGRAGSRRSDRIYRCRQFPDGAGAGRPEIEAIKFAETEMVQTQDAGVAAPVKGLLRRLPLQEGAQAAAEGVPQFLRDAVAAELLVGDRGQNARRNLASNSRKRTVVRRRTDAPSWERRSVIPLLYPGASQKQSSGRDSRRSAPPSALPRNICFCVSHNTSSASNFVYILLCQLQIQLDDNGSNSLRNLCGEYRGQVPPHWRCIDASSLC